MNILLIGSGGREHALALALKKSPSAGKLYCTPGNPGIFELAEKAELDSSDFAQVAAFCKENSIELVVVGPEQPLADGITDYLENEGINVFGPGRIPAQLEASKGFAKEFMMKYDIPTAAYKVFDATESEQAHNYLGSASYPLVLKADGLAAGKGVIIVDNEDDAIKNIDEMFAGLFKEAGKKVVVEEFLQGEEASILAVTDGKDFVTLASSQDHKRAQDGDKGKNTGGMGAYAPAPIVDDAVLQKVKDRIIRPAIDGMAKEGTPFAGCLYAGLMINNGEPFVVEFNVRFGDPETQAVLSVLDADFAALLHSAAIKKLDAGFIKNIAKETACCVIMASDGYPDSYEKGYNISGIDEAEKGQAIVYHAGTAMKDGKLINTGGRVLSVCGLGDDLKAAIDNAYEAVNKIHFDNAFFRKDIGLKGLK